MWSKHRARWEKKDGKKVEISSLVESTGQLDMSTASDPKPNDSKEVVRTDTLKSIKKKTELTTTEIPFDQYEKTFKSGNHKSDACKELVLWPKDDVEVKEVPRKNRTVAPFLPVCISSILQLTHEDDLQTKMHDYVTECVRLYTKDWRLVQKNYRKYGSNSEIKDNFAALADQSYDVDKTAKMTSAIDEKALKAYIDENRDVDLIRKELKKDLVSSKLRTTPDSRPPIATTSLRLTQWSKL